jgi:hypothetical protein
MLSMYLEKDIFWLVTACYYQTLIRCGRFDKSPVNDLPISDSEEERLKYKYYVHSFCFCLKQRPIYISEHSSLETGFCLCLQVKPTQLGPINRAGLETGTSSINWAQLSMFYLKMETESSLWNIVFLNINRMVF